MTLSPMEPNVSDNSRHGLERIRVCKLHEMLKRSTGESLFFQVAGQASGQSVVDSIQGLFCEADRWLVGNRTQPSHAKHSAEDFKEVNGQNSPWRTREVTRVVDRDRLMRGFIS
jgi:hypothetical protein